MASRSRKDDVPASQTSSQVQKAIANMDKGEQQRMIDEVVKYLLIMDQKKVPIKKLDINKNVLKEHSKAFPMIIAESAKKLSAVFGVELKELDEKHKGSYILVNKLDIDDVNNHLDWSPEDNSKMGLVMVVLSLIFMSGNVMPEQQMWNALKKLGIDPDLPHEVFGDVKKMIRHEFVRQCYLEMEHHTNIDPPMTQFKWGKRAYLETTKRNILNFVSQIYGVEATQWVSQWQESEEPEDQPGPSSQR